MVRNTVDPPKGIYLEKYYPDDNPKTTIGVTKVPLHLVPPILNHHTALAFADGAAKYGAYNWREKTVSSSVYLAAAKRHLDAWWDGEDLSKDAKVLHLGHAAACIAILMDAESIGKLNDDRPPPGATARLQEEYANNKKELNDGILTNPVPTDDLQESLRALEGRFGKAGIMAGDGGPLHLICGNKGAWLVNLSTGETTYLSGRNQTSDS